MKLSYAIPVCNELVEIQHLIKFLLDNKRPEDEIVVLYDSKNGDPGVETYLRKMNVERTLFRWKPFKFNGNFSDMKNRLNGMCEGDYIFQIDADEMLNEYMIKIIPQVLEINQGVDLMRVPRIRWHGEVHEKIIGHATHAVLPIKEDFALIHNKTIERQEKQNAYYDTL